MPERVLMAKTPSNPDPMVPSAATERVGSHTLQSLLWEHDKATESLKALFEKYKAREKEAEEQKYNAVSERIVYNLMLNLDTNGLAPGHVFIEDFEHSLKVLCVFKQEDYSTKWDQICAIFKNVRALSISHESRDFRWLAMSDEAFEYSLPLEEFHKSLSLK